MQKLMCFVLSRGWRSRGAECETVASVSTSSCRGSLTAVMEANALRTELRSMSEESLVRNGRRHIHLLMPELTYDDNRSQRASFQADVDDRGRIDATRMPALRFSYPGSSATVAEARVLRSLPIDTREVGKRPGGELDAKQPPAWPPPQSPRAEALAQWRNSFRAR